MSTIVDHPGVCDEWPNKGASSSQKCQVVIQLNCSLGFQIALSIFSYTIWNNAYVMLLASVLRSRMAESGDQSTERND